MDGLELICGYACGTFKPAEKNYHSNEKEILALINTIKRFQVYLIPVQFIARTDNKNVFLFPPHKYPWLLQTRTSGKMTALVVIF